MFGAVDRYIMYYSCKAFFGSFDSTEDLLKHLICSASFTLHLKVCLKK